MIFFLFFLTFLSLSRLQSIPQYYATAADEAHFYLLKNLIGSIHYTNFDQLKEIAVFDLGLSLEQKEELKRMQKVAIYIPEMVNPEMLTYAITAPNGRMIRGNFSWKPVIFKQSLEMFPYVLYMDSGTTVLKSLDDLFEQIDTNGYFLLSCTKDSNNNVPHRLTQNVIKAVLPTRLKAEQAVAFDQDTYMIDGGLQGLSRRIYSSYVLPLYEYAHNKELFKDDGTAPLGYGEARHDQTLCTLLAYWLNLKIHDEGNFSLDLKENSKEMRIDWQRSEINTKTIIYRSRADYMFKGGQTHYVRYK